MVSLSKFYLLAPLATNTNISFRNYSIINCFGPANNERACCGVSVLVKDGTPHQYITLNTNLQAVAVNINCHRPMKICSVYLPPNRPVDIGELRQLVKQLPKPFMLLGYFNGTTQCGAVGASTHVAK